MRVMTVLEYFDWKAALQIFVLAGIIYSVFDFLSVSPGGGILRGFTVLTVVLSVVTLLLAKSLRLRVIDWLVTQFFLPFGVIALLIIFHTELRRGLWRIGQSRIFGVFSPGGLAPISEIVDATVAMSRQRIGALLAIERDVSLGAYAERGQRLDAQVSAPLLISIFHPGALLHDGAVIISGNKIVAAGCIFPLTENPEFGVALGTRHRAAIGITEESDAIAIVVSEETGAISLAVRGKLTANLDRESLRAALRQIYVERRLGAQPSHAS